MTHQQMLFTHVINVINSISNKYEVTAQRYEENEPNRIGIIFIQSGSDLYDYDGVISESKSFELRLTCQNNQDDIFENWQFIEDFVDIFENALSTVDGLIIDAVKHLSSKVIPLYTNAYGLQELKCIINLNCSFEN